MGQRGRAVGLTQSPPAPALCFWGPREKPGLWTGLDPALAVGCAGLVA